MPTDQTNLDDLCAFHFMVNERPASFITTARDNLHFLAAIDPSYWDYQATVHENTLNSLEATERQHAAAALRIAYGQALETLFAIVCAVLQCPSCPLAWVHAYRNAELRELVKRIHARDQAVPSRLDEEVSWRGISRFVHREIPADRQSYDVSEAFGKFWAGLAGEFLETHFEQEYNSLKHGMRSKVGGFALALSAGDSEESRFQSRSEYGSTFWQAPERPKATRHTFHLGRHVSHSWTPKSFARRLRLVGNSIGNVTSAIHAKLDSHATGLALNWPDAVEEFGQAWAREGQGPIHCVSFGHSLRSEARANEPTAEQIRSSYRQPQRLHARRGEQPGKGEGTKS